MTTSNEEEYKKVAEDLFRQNMEEINNTIEQMVAHMIEQGYDPLIYGIAHNFEDIRTGKTTKFECWPVLKDVNLKTKEENN